MSKAGEGATPDADLYQVPGYKRENADDIKMAQDLLAEAGYPGGRGPAHLQARLSCRSRPLGSPFPILRQPAQRKPGHRHRYQRPSSERSWSRSTRRTSTWSSAPSSTHRSKNHTPLWQVVWTTGASQNFGKYSNPEFDDIVVELNGELDAMKRAELFRKGEEMLGRQTRLSSTSASPPTCPCGTTTSRDCSLRTGFRPSGAVSRRSGWKGRMGKQMPKGTGLSNSLKTLAATTLVALLVACGGGEPDPDATAVDEVATATATPTGHSDRRGGSGRSSFRHTGPGAGERR